jgi:uncharacterized protein YndB with AHSA1/START domain
MRPLTRGYIQGFDTPASSATLWRALVEPAALALWYAADTIVEPRAGGRYCTVSALFGRREAHIERFEPGLRLQLLFDSNPAWPPLTDNVLIEDFLIDDRKGQRMLRVMGSGIPAAPEWTPILKRLRAGWAVAFARLQNRLRAGEIVDPAA